MASSVSLMVPIWFTLIRIELATFFDARCRRSLLVTKRSSPTSWMRSPINSVRYFQPSQSSSASPSSMETMGYCRVHAPRTRHLQQVSSRLSDFLKTYLPDSLL